MSKSRVKLLIWFVFGSVMVGAGLLFIRAASNVFTYFNESADPATVLNIVPNVPVELAVKYEWLNEETEEGREIEPATLDLIQGQYMRGWLQWNLSYLRGEPYGLNSYFNDAAFDAVVESVNLARQQGWMMTQTDLQHHIKLHFYSADGSIVNFTDHDVITAEIIRNGDGTPITARTVRADYDVVMMRLDGNWQVRHWVRKNAEIIDPSDYEPPPPRDDFVRVNGRSLTLNNEPFTIRGINYYPQDTPWHLFWENYNPDEIDTDFQLINTLGMNSVRVFVPYEWPDPPVAEDETDSHSPVEIEPEQVEQQMRDNLQHLLDTADRHDLKVIVTLFDFRTDYQILLWPNADQQLHALVPYFAEHPAILAWDIKNEPDFDRAGNTPEMVDLWLGHIAYQIRQHDPNHLVTIGWADIENAHLLADAVDFVSFHYYAPADQLVEKMAALETAVSDKPIVLTEFGLPTLNSPFRPHGHTQNEQAVYYSDIRQALAQTDHGGYMAWTLYDFTRMPFGVGGGAPQKHLGIIDKRGDLKAAAFFLAEELPPRTPKWRITDRLFKPFYYTALLTLLLAGFVTILIVRVYRPTFADRLMLPIFEAARHVLRYSAPVFALIAKARRAVVRGAWTALRWGLRPFRFAWRLGWRLLGWGWQLVWRIRPFVSLYNQIDAKIVQIINRVNNKMVQMKAELEETRRLSEE